MSWHRWGAWVLGAAALLLVANCSSCADSLKAPAVIAAAGDAQVTLTWDQVVGADAYNLYWSTDPGAGRAGTKVAGVSSPATVSGLTNGTRYYFSVAASSNGGEGPLSAEVDAVPQLPAPASPTGVAVSTTIDSATVTWASVTGASGYNLYWSATSGTGTAGTKIAGASSGQVVTGLAMGTAYYFVVTALNAGGESAPSAEVSGTTLSQPPPAPTGVTATTGHGGATVKWDPVPGATSYAIYYSSTSGSGLAGTKWANAASPQLVEPLSFDWSYYFVVTASNAVGESAPSAEVSAWIDAPLPPGKPTNVAAVAGDGRVTVSWDPVKGATSYEIYFSTTQGSGTSGSVWPGAASPQIVDALTNGIPYYFVVVAHNDGGNGVPSDEVSATPTAPPVHVLSASASGNTGMVVRTDGTLWGWGDNSQGQLVTGDFASRNLRVRIGVDSDWKSVSVGAAFALAIKANGTLWGWGMNNVGQTGTNSTAVRVSTPTQVGSDTDWAQVAAGGNLAVALKTGGTLWTWGLNTTGQLGLGNATGPTTCGANFYPCAITPQKVGTDTDWAQIAAGGNHAAAIKTGGTLWTWGDNRYGELGLGTNTGPSLCSSDNSGCALSPTAVGAAADWKSVSSSSESVHTVALKTDGTLWTWGYNQQGQLGTGDNTGPTTCAFRQNGIPMSPHCGLVPLQVSAGSLFKAADTGNFISVAVRNDGTLWTWGQGSAALGNTGSNQLLPGQVGAETNWSSVSAGGYNDMALAVRGDGLVFSWGNGNNGELGQGDALPRPLPTQLP